MGGLRVTELDVRFAMAHGIFAQIILCATVLIAAATSRLWITSRHAQHSSKRCCIAFSSTSLGRCPATMSL